MPRRPWQFRILDIIYAIAKIQRYTQLMTEETFAADEKTVDAVLANIAVVGEAAARVPNEVAQRDPEIPWAEMRGIRNVVVHQYFGVSIPIVWETTQRDLPDLVPELRRIVDDNPE